MSSRECRDLNIANIVPEGTVRNGRQPPINQQSSTFLNPSRQFRTMNCSNVSPIRNPETQATDGAQQPQDVPQAQRGEAAELCKEYNQYRVSFDQVPN